MNRIKTKIQKLSEAIATKKLDESHNQSVNDASPNDIEKWYSTAVQVNAFDDIANNAAKDVFEILSKSKDDIYDLQNLINDIIETLDDMKEAYKNALVAALNYNEADEDDQYEYSLEFDDAIKLFNDSLTYITHNWAINSDEFAKLKKFRFTPANIKIKD